MTFRNDDKYEGEWKNGEINGEGKYIFGNRDHFEGEWINGKRVGQGAYQWRAGIKYVGQWENDKMAVGELIMEDGSSYYYRDDGKF